MKVKLNRQKRTDSDIKPWRESFPFAVNRRGLLTHRVKNVSTIYCRGEKSHHHVGYLCGNGCCFELDEVKTVLVEKPPSDRLLCSFCEAVAQRKQLPSGDKLAGTSTSAC